MYVLESLGNLGPTAQPAQRSRRQFGGLMLAQAESGQKEGRSLCYLLLPELCPHPQT